MMSRDIPCLLLCFVRFTLSQRKNVLFIGSDDMRPNLNLYSDVTEGVFASPTMHTPNLDKDSISIQHSVWLVLLLIQGRLLSSKFWDTSKYFFASHCICASKIGDGFHWKIIESKKSMIFPFDSLEREASCLSLLTCSRRYAVLVDPPWWPVEGGKK